MTVAEIHARNQQRDSLLAKANKEQESLQDQINKINKEEESLVAAKTAYAERQKAYKKKLEYKLTDKDLLELKAPMVLEQGQTRYLDFGKLDTPAKRRAVRNLFKSYREDEGAYKESLAKLTEEALSLTGTGLTAPRLIEIRREMKKITQELKRREALVNQYVKGVQWHRTAVARIANKWGVSPREMNILNGDAETLASFEKTAKHLARQQKAVPTIVQKISQVRAQISEIERDFPLLNEKYAKSKYIFSQNKSYNKVKRIQELHQGLLGKKGIMGYLEGAQLVPQEKVSFNKTRHISTISGYGSRPQIAVSITQHEDDFFKTLVLKKGTQLMVTEGIAFDDNLASGITEDIGRQKHIWKGHEEEFSPNWKLYNKYKNTVEFKVVKEEYERLNVQAKLGTASHELRQDIELGVARKTLDVGYQPYKKAHPRSTIRTYLKNIMDPQQYKNMGEAFAKNYEEAVKKNLSFNRTVEDIFNKETGIKYNNYSNLTSQSERVLGIKENPNSSNNIRLKVQYLAKVVIAHVDSFAKKKIKPNQPSLPELPIALQLKDGGFVSTNVDALVGNFKNITPGHVEPVVFDYKSSQEAYPGQKAQVTMEAWFAEKVGVEGAKASLILFGSKGKTRVKVVDVDRSQNHFQDSGEMNKQFEITESSSRFFSEQFKKMQQQSDEDPTVLTSFAKNIKVVQFAGVKRDEKTGNLINMGSGWGVEYTHPGGQKATIYLKTFLKHMPQLIGPHGDILYDVIVKQIEAAPEIRKGILNKIYDLGQTVDQYGTKNSKAGIRAALRFGARVLDDVPAEYKYGKTPLLYREREDLLDKIRYSLKNEADEYIYDQAREATDEVSPEPSLEASAKGARQAEEAVSQIESERVGRAFSGAQKTMKGLGIILDGTAEKYNFKFDKSSQDPAVVFHVQEVLDQLLDDFKPPKGSEDASNMEAMGRSIIIGLADFLETTKNLGLISSGFTDVARKIRNFYDGFRINPFQKGKQIAEYLDSRNIHEQLLKAGRNLSEAEVAEFLAAKTFAKYYEEENGNVNLAIDKFQKYAHFSHHDVFQYGREVEEAVFGHAKVLTPRLATSQEAAEAMRELPRVRDINFGWQATVEGETEIPVISYIDKVSGKLIVVPLEHISGHLVDASPHYQKQLKAAILAYTKKDPDYGAEFRKVIGDAGGYSEWASNFKQSFSQGGKLKDGTVVRAGDGGINFKEEKGTTWTFDTAVSKYLNHLRISEDADISDVQISKEYNMLPIDLNNYPFSQLELTAAEKKHLMTGNKGKPFTTIYGLKYVGTLKGYVSAGQVSANPNKVINTFMREHPVLPAVMFPLTGYHKDISNYKQSDFYALRKELTEDSFKVGGRFFGFVREDVLNELKTLEDLVLVRGRIGTTRRKLGAVKATSEQIALIKQIKAERAHLLSEIDRAQGIQKEYNNLFEMIDEIFVYQSRIAEWENYAKSLPSSLREDALNDFKYKENKRIVQSYLNNHPLLSTDVTMLKAMEETNQLALTQRKKQLRALNAPHSDYNKRLGEAMRLIYGNEGVSYLGEGKERGSGLIPITSIKEDVEKMAKEKSALDKILQNPELSVQEVLEAAVTAYMRLANANSIMGKAAFGTKLSELNGIKGAGQQKISFEGVLDGIYKRVGSEAQLHGANDTDAVFRQIVDKGFSERTIEDYMESRTKNISKLSRNLTKANKAMTKASVEYGGKEDLYADEITAYNQARLDLNQYTLTGGSKVGDFMEYGAQGGKSAEVIAMAQKRELYTANKKKTDDYWKQLAVAQKAAYHPGVSEEIRGRVYADEIATVDAIKQKLQDTGLKVDMATIQKEMADNEAKMAEENRKQQTTTALKDHAGYSSKLFESSLQRAGTEKTPLDLYNEEKLAEASKVLEGTPYTPQDLANMEAEDRKHAQAVYDTEKLHFNKKQLTNLKEATLGAGTMSERNALQTMFDNEFKAAGMSKRVEKEINEAAQKGFEGRGPEYVMKTGLSRYADALSRGKASEITEERSALEKTTSRLYKNDLDVKEAMGRIQEVDIKDALTKFVEDLVTLKALVNSGLTKDSAEVKKAQEKADRSEAKARGMVAKESLATQQDLDDKIRKVKRAEQPRKDEQQQAIKNFREQYTAKLADQATIASLQKMQESQTPAQKRVSQKLIRGMQLSASKEIGYNEVTGEVNIGGKKTLIEDEGEKAKLGEFIGSQNRGYSRKVAEIQGREPKPANFIAKVMGSFQMAMARAIDYGIAYGMIAKFKQMVTNIVNLTKQLNVVSTNIEIVTGKSEAKIKEMIGSYSDLAKALGRTTLEVAASANDFLRMGYAGEDAAELITQAMTLSTLGMIDAGEAAKYLTAAIKGYGVEVKDVSMIVDMATALDMQYATSAGEILQAMSRTAASARLARVDMASLQSMVTVTLETSQKSAQSIGEAFKTAFARYGNVKAGKVSFSDLGDETEGINDIESALSKLGIRIRENNAQWRSYQDVIDEIGARWESWDDIQRNLVTTAMFGTRQREVGTILLSNFDTYKKATMTAEGAEGTGAEKLRDYTDSLEASIKRVTVAWEALTQEGGFSSLLTKLNNVLAQVIDNFKTFVIVLGLFGLAKYHTSLVTTGRSLFSKIGEKVGMPQYDENGQPLSTKQVLSKWWIGKKEDVSEAWNEGDKRSSGRLMDSIEGKRSKSVLDGFSSSIVTASTDLERFSVVLRKIEIEHGGIGTGYRGPTTEREAQVSILSGMKPSGDQGRALMSKWFGKGDSQKSLTSWQKEQRQNVLNYLEKKAEDVDVRPGLKKTMADLEQKVTTTGKPFKVTSLSAKDQMLYQNTERQLGALPTGDLHQNLLDRMDPAYLKALDLTTPEGRENLVIAIKQKQAQENVQIGTTNKKHTMGNAARGLTAMGTTMVGTMAGASYGGKLASNLGGDAQTGSMIGSMTGGVAGMLAIIPGGLPFAAALAGLTLILTAATTDWKKVIGDMINSVGDLKTIFVEFQDSTDKIKESKDKLDAGLLSLTDTQDVREQLFLQQEGLVEKYGTLASSLDLINGSYQDIYDTLLTIAKGEMGDWETDNKKIIRKYERFLRRGNNPASAQRLFSENQAALSPYGGKQLLEQDTEAYKSMVELNEQLKEATTSGNKPLAEAISIQIGTLRDTISEAYSEEFFGDQIDSYVKQYTFYADTYLNKQKFLSSMTTTPKVQEALGILSSAEGGVSAGSTIEEMKAAGVYDAFSYLQDVAKEMGIELEDFTSILVESGYLSPDLGNATAGTTYKRYQALMAQDTVTTAENSELNILRSNLNTFLELIGATAEEFDKFSDILGKINLNGTLFASLADVDTYMSVFTKIGEDLKNGLISAENFDAVMTQYPELVEYFLSSVDDVKDLVADAAGVATILQKATIRGMLSKNATYSSRVAGNYAGLTTDVNGEQMPLFSTLADLGEVYGALNGRAVNSSNIGGVNGLIDAETGEYDEDKLHSFYLQHAGNAFLEANPNASPEIISEWYQGYVGALKIYAKDIDSINGEISEDTDEIFAKTEEMAVLNTEKTEYEKAYKYMEKLIDKQIEKLQTVNDERKKTIELMNLEEALAKARENKVKVYKEGQGFVYEEDADAVAEAEKKITEYLDEQSIQNQIDALNDLKTTWQDWLDKADMADFKKSFDALFDTGLEGSPLLKGLDDMARKIDIVGQLFSYTQQILNGSLEDPNHEIFNSIINGTALEEKGQLLSPISDISTSGNGGHSVEGTGLSSADFFRGDQKSVVNPAIEEAVTTQDTMAKLQDLADWGLLQQGKVYYNPNLKNGQYYVFVNSKGIVKTVGGVNDPNQTDFMNTINAKSGYDIPDLWSSRTRSASLLTDVYEGHTLEDYGFVNYWNDQDGAIVRTNQGGYNPGNQTVTATGSQGHASGLVSASASHLALVGEKGPELSVVPKKGGILPANITQRLWELGKNPAGYISQYINMQSAAQKEQAGNSNEFAYTLNGVTVYANNADEFIESINSKFKNMAIGNAHKRK